MKSHLRNFDRFYMEPLFIKNIEGENPMTEAERKLALANKAWTAKSK